MPERRSIFPEPTFECGKPSRLIGNGGPSELLSAAADPQRPAFGCFELWRLAQPANRVLALLRQERFGNVTALHKDLDGTAAANFDFLGTIDRSSVEFYLVAAPDSWQGGRTFGFGQTTLYMRHRGKRTKWRAFLTYDADARCTIVRDIVGGA